MQVAYSDAGLSKPLEIAQMVSKWREPRSPSTPCVPAVCARLVEGQIRPSAHDMPEERVIREVILAYQPNKAFRRTGALGAFVLFLCSDAAGSITGAAPPIEGG